MNSVRQVFRLRDNLCHKLAEYCGSEMEGDVFEHFVDRLLSFLPTGIPLQAVYHSARAVLGGQLEEKALREFAWRLAGNIERLRNGEIVLPWTAQPEPELMPLQIMDHETVEWRGRLYERYKMRILAGRACPMTIKHQWERPLARYFASHIFGFSPPWGEFPYKQPSELVRLRFVAKIDQEFCVGNKPGFNQVSKPKIWGCLAWNKQILKRRRHDLVPCPEGYTHPCHQCWIGYDRCEAAVHSTTFVEKKCESCGRTGAHDPSSSSSICIECVQKSLVPGLGQKK